MSIGIVVSGSSLYGSGKRRRSEEERNMTDELTAMTAERDALLVRVAALEKQLAEQRGSYDTRLNVNDKPARLNVNDQYPHSICY